MKKNNTKPTLTVGIPAFNEGKNIQSLLWSLTRQKQDGYILKEIIVVSDGSTDDTPEKVRDYAAKNIRLIHDKKRLGKSARLNQIFRSFKSDALVLMDADIMIKDRSLLAKTMAQADIQHTGIAGINASPFASDYFFSQTLEIGVEITKAIAARWNKGNNYLSFRGAFLLLDGKLAKKIHMPKTLVNNDAYLYFAAKTYGYTSTYLPSCYVYYRSPHTLEDHVKQSSRFHTSKDELIKYFNLNWESEYKLPLMIVMVSILHSLLKKPVYTVSYLVVNALSSLKKHTNITSTWSVAASTK